MCGGGHQASYWATYTWELEQQEEKEAEKLVDEVEGLIQEVDEMLEESASPPSRHRHALTDEPKSTSDRRRQSQASYR